VTGADYLSLFIVFIAIVMVGFLGASEVAITRMNRVRAVRLREERRRGDVIVRRETQICRRAWSRGWRNWSRGGRASRGRLGSNVSIAAGADGEDER